MGELIGDIIEFLLTIIQIIIIGIIICVSTFIIIGVSVVIMQWICSLF